MLSIQKNGPPGWEDDGQTHDSLDPALQASWRVGSARTYRARVGEATSVYEGEKSCRAGRKEFNRRGVEGQKGCRGAVLEPIGRKGKFFRGLDRGQPTDRHGECRGAECRGLYRLTSPVALTFSPSGCAKLQHRCEGFAGSWRVGLVS